TSAEWTGELPDGRVTLHSGHTGNTSGPYGELAELGQGANPAGELYGAQPIGSNFAASSSKEFVNGCQVGALTPTSCSNLHRPRTSSPRRRRKPSIPCRLSCR